MRQASLGLENLKRELAKPKTRLPRCLIVKEIGALFIAEGDEEAEEILTNLLEDEGVNEKFVAFCCLCSIDSDNLKKETHERLKAFRENPENKELVVLSEKAMPHFKQTIPQLIPQGSKN